LGIAPRRLNGWEPTETTEHFDADGVLVSRSVTTREPEFDDEQRDLLLAGTIFEAAIDSNGQLIADATDPENNPNNLKRRSWFTATGPLWNWGEKARLDDIDRYKAEFPKDHPPNLNGAYWVVEKHSASLPREPAEPAE